MRIRSTPAGTILRKREALRRELSEKPDLAEVRVAILGGSTTTEVADLLELLLLDEGIRPVFYRSEYNRYFEEAVVDNARLVEFAPNFVFVHTSCANIQGFPPLDASELDFDVCVSAETRRFSTIWNAIHESTGSLIIQNNFEPLDQRLLGNLDCVMPGGRSRFVCSLNREFAREARARKHLVLNDLSSIASTMGLVHFHDSRRWFNYKLISSPAGSLAIAKSVAATIACTLGRSRKCLVLDLDNVLWGGVIGDDGPEIIKIGKETAEGEAYTAFQQYCLRLRSRGILLAVCSKNTEHIAKQGFEHPDSVLKFSDFSSFKVNWEPKHENIRAIAEELNIGLDSLVFVDDNPAEREIVSAQLPMVAVPDVGSDISNFIQILEDSHYFEPISLSREDLQRSSQYQANSRRLQEQAQFANYDEYLESLEMTAEISPFTSVYLERIVQLINKTNQFNLTTKRYTQAEVEFFASDPDHITLYGRLTDKFGDNGLISVILGRREDHVLHIDLWLMSCRVLKRGMELAMLDSLLAACRQRGIIEVYGYYIPTEKNDLVRDHYEKLGFQKVEDPEPGHSKWKLLVADIYPARNRHIAVKDLVHD